MFTKGTYHIDVKIPVEVTEAEAKEIAVRILAHDAVLAVGGKYWVRRESKRCAATLKSGYQCGASTHELYTWKGQEYCERHFKLLTKGRGVFGITDEERRG